MTEERIRELVAEYGCHLHRARGDAQKTFLQRFEEIVIRIAAEARNEAIDEMQIVGWDAVIDEAEKIYIENDGRFGLLINRTIIMNRLCSAHQNAAARLKEGKRTNPFEGWIPCGPTAKSIQAEAEARLKE